MILRERIAERLRDSAPSPDLESEARALLPPGLARELFPRPLIPAAVLVPVVERETGLTLLLTRRTERLRDHPGQISFPGGRLDAGDAGPLAAALRETSEELGIPSSLVEVAGYLPAQPVITGFVVSPVVGFLPGHATTQPDPLEVAEVLEMPLAFFLEESNARHTWRSIGATDLPVVEYHYRGQRVWGATANIIRSLIDKIR